MLAALCLPPPSQAASALAELIAASQSSDEFDASKVAAVYRETILSGDGIDRAVARLTAFSRQPGLSLTAQANLHVAVAQLQWRDGEIDQAVTSSDKALEIAPTADTLLLKARLLDSGGDTEQARDWYRRAAQAFGDGDEQWLIQTRLAMMEVSGRSVESLGDLAGQRDQDFRNQAAVVLALLGRPERAFDLYKPRAEDGRLYRQHLRLAEWALQSEEYELARAQAWLAYEEAEVRVDRLYALALLTESYRMSGELDALLEDLTQRDPQDQELLRLRVETLIETEEYGQAIELYKQLEGDEADIVERRRLVSLYEAAGDTGAMVREYQRMMEAEPDQVQWYDGLAAHYLNLADNGSALEVWETLEGRNPDRAEILVEAAVLMLQMGFMDEGLAMVERHMRSYGPDVGGLFFLFDSWLDKGEDEKALNVLVRLEDHLPADAAERRSLADAYERLSRPQDALRVFEAIRDSEGGLGYDEQMRLAWLYSLVERKQDALNQWQEISVGVESPARRSFAEGQLMLLASELGALGDMAVELEGMLTEGTANRNQMNLLVRIYTEVGDKLSATEIINEYAGELGEDEIGRQELLAQVFMLLEDYPAHDKALRRLYEIDPENRVDHIKSIIINLLTFDLATESDERFEEINRWIGELRRFDAEAVSGEFEASIYSMGGFGDQAVESYRRALVEHPENSDNLLLLADVLKSTGRTGEAVAILQFFAEHAVEDNEFVVAVDGIINMIGARTFFQQPDPEVLGRLDWTRRVILERIAGRANKFYLYELLADIAREKGDTEGSFLALENSLAEAGIRRPAILRELLTLATPNAGFSGFNTGAGDIERQLKHGRRLVGLRQQLPPEVYIDIGKSLLKKDDVSGAERAFEMIYDITGLIDVNRTKAEIFEEEGYDQESREYYNRALNVNRDSLELLHKTGFLYEADGRFDVAFRRYLQAIAGLLRRQSTQLAAGAPPIDPNSWQAIVGQRTDTTVSREFRENYPSLEQGLLLTWPEDPEESARAVAELKALFEGELVYVLDRSGGDLLALARYGRLDRAARLIRRVGFYLDDTGLSQYADLRLLEHFGEDEAYARHISEQYGASGQPNPARASKRSRAAHGGANASASSLPLRRQSELAESRDDFETKLQLLRLAGATEEIGALLSDRILAGRYRDGLGYALALLSEPEFKRLALAVAPRLMDDRDALLRLLGSNADTLLEAERIAGRPLIPQRELMTLLLSKKAWEYANYSANAGGGIWNYLAARASLDDRIRYLQSLAQQASAGWMFTRGGTEHPLHGLLKLKLSARQRQDIVRAVTGYLSRLDTKNENLGFNLARTVMIADARPENAGVLYRIADYIQERWPANFNLRPLLEALYQDRPEAVFEQLVGSMENLPQFGFFVASAPGLSSTLASMASRLLDEVRFGTRIAPNIAWAAYETEDPARYGASTSNWRRKLQRKVHLLQRLRGLYPEDDRYRYELIDAWLSLGYSARAGRAVASEYQAAPENESWRFVLFLLRKSQQRFAEALAVATDGGADLRDAKVLREMMEAITARARVGADATWRVASRLYAYSRPASVAPAPAGIGPRDGATQDALQRLREALASGDHERGRLALRAAWRRLLARDRSPYAPLPSSQLLQAAGSLLAAPLEEDAPQAHAGHVNSFWALSRAGDAPQQAAMLFGAVADAPYGAGELGRYLRAMPAESRRGFYPLYEYLAKACGAGDKRLRALGAKLRTLDDHDFTLWMLLRDQASLEFGPERLGAFEERLATMSDPDPYQLLLAARIFATAGAAERAVEFYKLVAARRIQHNEYSGRQFSFYPFSFDPTAFTDLPALIDEAAAKLPPEAAREVLDAVLLLAGRSDDIPAANAMFDIFALSSLDKLYPPEDALAQARRHSFDALQEPERSVGGSAARALEQARAYARTGDLAHATKILRAMLTAPEPAASTLRVGAQEQAKSNLAVRDLRKLYGMPHLNTGLRSGVYSAVQELVLRRERIFPGAEDAAGWPNAAEWTGAVARVLLDGLESGELAVEYAVELLLVVAWRLHQAGERARASELLNRVLASVAQSELLLDASSVASLASMASVTGDSLPLDLVTGALQQGTLNVQQQLVLLRSYADSGDAKKVLEIARNSGLDHGLAVITQLRDLAERSGDMAYAEELQRRIEREESARDLLLQDQADAPPATVMMAP